MMRYSTFSRSPELELHHQMPLNVRMDLGVLAIMGYSTFSKTGASPPDAVKCQSGPGSNGHDGVLYILQNSRTGASPPDPVKFHTQDIFISEQENQYQ